jgi:hypothetical protein
MIAAFSSCKSDSRKAEIPQSNQQASAGYFNESIDRDFNAFIEQFSIDSAFQLNRIKFPLPIKQYNIENDKDTIVYRQNSTFLKMDFRKKKSGSVHDEWKQEIVLDKSGTNARIEIRGIENGIVVDYFFEKRNGKWMLVRVNDSST